MLGIGEFLGPWLGFAIGLPLLIPLALVGWPLMHLVGRAERALERHNLARVPR